MKHTRHCCVSGGREVFWQSVGECVDPWPLSLAKIPNPTLLSHGSSHQCVWKVIGHDEQVASCMVASSLCVWECRLVCKAPWQVGKTRKALYKYSPFATTIIIFTLTDSVMCVQVPQFPNIFHFKTAKSSEPLKLHFIRWRTDVLMKLKIWGMHRQAGAERLELPITETVTSLKPALKPLGVPADRIHVRSSPLHSLLEEKAPNSLLNPLTPTGN